MKDQIINKIMYEVTYNNPIIEGESKFNVEEYIKKTIEITEKELNSQKLSSKNETNWVSEKEFIKSSPIKEELNSPTKTTKKSSRWGMGYATRDGKDSQIQALPKSEEKE